MIPFYRSGLDIDGRREMMKHMFHKADLSIKPVNQTSQSNLSIKLNN